MRLQKKPDWQACLNRYLAEGARAEYRMGTVDCGLFVRGAVEAMTGQDCCYHIVMPYKTKHKALKALRSAGYKNLIDFLDTHFTAKDVGAFGDIALHKGILGIIQGTQIYIRLKGGLGLIPLTPSTRIWGV